MPYIGPRIRVSDESVNTWGTRVLTSGWRNRENFEANPMMLYNHNEAWRGLETEMLPIGFWKDFKVEGGEISMVPCFDIEDKGMGKKIGGKYKRKVLRAASIGIRIISTSESPDMMLPGQTRPTITEWELREVSIVDIPANKHAVCFYDADGNYLNLSDTGCNVLPLIGEPSDKKLLKNKSVPTMEDKTLKMVCGFLGLSDTATILDVQTDISSMNTKVREVDSLKAQLADFKKKETEKQQAEGVLLLNEAIKDGRIAEAQRAHFSELLKTGFEATKGLIESMQKRVALADIPKGKDETEASGASVKHKGMSFSELRKKDGKELERLKEQDFETFKELYKSEFGRDYRA